MTFKRWLMIGAGMASAIFIVILPFYASPYANQQVTLVAIYAVVILGLNIVTGYAGQVSLAQAAFFGLGAYSAAIAGNAGWHPVLALLAAIAVPSAVGYLMALPAVRLRGHALAMLTIALSLVAVPLVKRFDDLTGGSQGLSVTMGEAPEWSGLATDQWAYLVALVIAALLFLFTRNMIKGKVGRALALIRTNEIVATAMGIPVNRYKIITFAIGAGCAGVGGFMFAYCVRFVSPDTLNFLFGITLLAALVIGGLRSLLGPVLGAAFYVYVPALAGTVSPEQSALIYGGALVLVVLFLPGGLAAIFRLARSSADRRKRVTNANPGGGPKSGTNKPSDALQIQPQRSTIQ